MVEVRRVDVDDWPAVREVRLAALEESPDWFWATYDDEAEKPEAWWRTFIGAGAWFIAWEGERAVGIAAAVADPEFEETDRHLISMWVAPAVRKRGIGEQLVEAVKDWARQERLRELRLHVTEGNEGAARLYERCGFQLTGNTVPLGRDPRVLEHEMRFRL